MTLRKNISKIERVAPNQIDRKRCWPIFDWFCRLWIVLFDRPEEGDPCVTIPGHVINKPDPCIYSQFMLMQLEQPVTWDNPDVRIFHNGVEQDTYNLTADTQYDIQIEVHNSSREKPALGTTAYVRWIEFGAGGQIKHLIDTLPANVPVWPGTDTINTTWKTPAVPGHYCIEVDLIHGNDGNPANNRGWNNTQVYAANSPVERIIRIFNQYPEGCPEVSEYEGPILRPHRAFAGWGVLGALFGFLLAPCCINADNLAIVASSYAGIGYVALTILGLLSEGSYTWIKRRRYQKDEKEKVDRLSCNLVEMKVDSYQYEDKVGKDFDPETRFKGKAAEWPAQVEPSSFLFAAGELFRDVELKVEAPDDPGPSGVFNINVWQGGVPTGGVTITITRGE